MGAICWYTYHEIRTSLEEIKPIAGCNVAEHVYFVSACLSHLSDADNSIRSNVLSGYLSNTNHRHIDGCYEGMAEDSYAVCGSTDYGLLQAIKTGLLWGQHSILHVNVERICTLHFMAGGSEVIGKLYSQWDKPIDTDYSHDARTGLYWTIS